MRRDLLSILRCPSCRTPDLELGDETEDALEVRSGVLRCTSCSAEFPLYEGVAELLPPLDGPTLLERRVRDSKVRDWAVERQRPYINDNRACPWVMRTTATNVEQGLSLVSLGGARALDVGAATCWSTRMLCERGATCVALDVSTGMLRDGEAQFATGVYFDRVGATMNELPFVDGSYDVVFASATIHHSDDIQRTLAEIGRVLKPAGSAVLVNEPMAGWLRINSGFGREAAERGMNWHIYRLREYLLAVEAAGMQAHAMISAALEGQLCGQIPGPDTLIMKSLPRIWPYLPGNIRRLCLTFGDLLFGLPAVILAQKRGG